MKKVYNTFKALIGTQKLGQKSVSILSRICLVSLILLTAGVGNAWGKTATRTWKAATAVKDGKGGSATVKVFVYNAIGDDTQKDSQTTSDASLVTAKDTWSKNYTLIPPSPTDSHYPEYSASVSDGYSFDGWYNTSNSKVSGDMTYYPGEGWLSHGATIDAWDYTYYAKFTPVTVNSVSSNPISTSGTALKLTEPSSKTAQIEFAVSNNADAMADFYDPTISGTGWSVDSSKLSGTKVIVYIKYTATKTTTQGDHTGTLTLKSKANSSQSATVYANVDLTPSFTISPESYDFGMFTIGVDSKKSKEFALENCNANAIKFSASGASTPFSASVSSDNKKVVVYFEPTAVGNGSWEQTITITAKNGQSDPKSATQTITVKGQAQDIKNPTYTCNIQDAYMVDDAAIDLKSLWTSDSDGDITYSIDSYTEHGTNNNAGTKPAITDNRYLSLGRACQMTLKLSQAKADHYFQSSATKTITINKYETSFDGSSYFLMVDGEQDAKFTYTNTSAAQPTANSANDFYFTYDDVTFTNSAKNKGNDFVTFNPSNQLITAHNAGSGKITLHQKETYKYTGATQSFNVTVAKYTSTFGSAANLGVTVEADVKSDYTLTYSKPESKYVGDVPSAGNPELNSGDYYYTLTQNVTATNTQGSPDATKAADYNAGTRTATGRNAGTCTVKLYQAETYKFKDANTSFVVTVEKNDPVFQWQAGPYNFNTVVDNIFSSSNTDFAYTMSQSTDTLVAYVSDNQLHVLSKDAVAKFTVEQAENYKWKYKKETYTVDPEKASNHVEFTITSGNRSNFWKSGTSDVSWDNNGYKLGEGGVTNAEEYFIIAFTGVPEYLTFDKHLDKIGLSLPVGSQTYVYESQDNKDWSNIAWSNTDRKEDVSSGNVPLQPTTRYLKFYYNGSIYCHFNNIKVTELKKFKPDSTSLNFGTNEINATVASQTFDFNYANAGHHVTLSVDDDHFSVSPSTIDTIGGEKVGKVAITVSYSTTELHKATGAKLTIKDELGHTATVTLKGETQQLTPTINWSSDESIFIEEDELTATNANGLTVTLSVPAADAQYVECEGNTATIIGYRAGTITVTATVTGNEIYKDATFTKDITITNLTKQKISWTQDLNHFKITDTDKSVQLKASASSNLPVTYELAGDQSGLSLKKNEQTGVWTLTYSTECKNTTIIAKQAGDAEYAPASPVTLPVRVMDPTKECDTIATVENKKFELKNTAKTYDVEIPDTLYVSFSRMKTGWLDIYTNGLTVEVYSEKEGEGTRLQSEPFEAKDINTFIADYAIPLKKECINAKSIKVATSAKNGYYIDKIYYKKHRYCTISTNSLSFATNPNTETTAQTFTVDYANYPISIECSNSKFTVSPTEFGDCDKHGTQTISVYYTAGANEGKDNGLVYIKDNTGKTLRTCTLSVSIDKVAQSITSHNITTSYNTTDKVTLTAATNSSAQEKQFTYSATPAGIASFNGNEMTFLQSGTIAITVMETGSNVYKPCSTTVANVVVNKVTPTLTLPTGTGVTYLQTLNNSTLSGGKATVTLHGVANTEVEGSFAWTNTTAVANGAAGSNSFEVTFTPTNKGMYNATTGMVAIAVEKANQSIVMKDGTAKVAVDKGLDANSEDSRLDLTSLITSQTTDAIDANRTGGVNFVVISDNRDHATISGTVFSANASGEYTIRATKEATNYYNAATAEFKVTVSARANSISIVGACTRYVDQEVENVLSSINSDAPLHTSSTDASLAYYDIDLNKIIIPNSEAKAFDQTKVTISIWQEENARFEASAVKTVEVTIKKYDNEIHYSWATPSLKMQFDQQTPIRLWSNNSETSLNIDQTGDPTIATYYVYPSAEKDTIRASYNIGTTTWSISQDETYKYKAAPAKILTVTVDTVPGGCDVLNDKNEYELHTISTGAAMKLSAPGDSLYFEGRRTPGSLNQFFIDYSTNGEQFTQLGDEITLKESYTDFKQYGPIGIPEGTTHIRFKTASGASFVKYYKNVRVTRKVYLDLEDADNNKISTLDMPLNTVSLDPLNINSSKASFFVDFNTCDDEIRIASNHPYYTINDSNKVFNVSDINGAGRREIEVTYTCASEDNSQAVISVYTKHSHRTIIVKGRTDKGRQEIIWKEPDFVNETVSLPVGYSGTAATTSSKLPLKYSVLPGEESVIRIAEDQYSFDVIGIGTAHLTATQEGNATLHPVSGTRIINATSKKLQVIRWTQDLTNSLTEGDTIRLEAEVHVLHPATGAYVKDEERTEKIVYTCPANNGKIVLIGKDSLYLLGAGETTVTASMPADDEYEDVADIIRTVKVRGINDTCETTMLVKKDTTYLLYPDIDWALSDLSIHQLSLTKPVISDMIEMDLSVGKPNKLSFVYSGEKTDKLVHLFNEEAVLKVQQRIRGSWSDITASKVTPKLEKKDTLENVSLSEEADAIRFVTEQGAYGRFFVSNVQVSMLPFLRVPQEIYINAEAGTAVDTTITIQYANAKAALTAETKRQEENIFVLRNDIFYPNCGKIGTYNWPVRFASTKVGEWTDTLTIKDSGSGDSVVVYIYANVAPGAVFVYEKETSSEGWGDDTNWAHGGELPTKDNHVLIKSDVIIRADTTVEVKSLSIDPAATVYVKGILRVMESTPDMEKYGNIHVFETGSLDLNHIEAGGLKVQDVVVDASLGNATGKNGASGQVYNSAKLAVNGKVYFQMAFDPDGAITYGWYDFTVPFTVNINGGIERVTDTGLEPMVCGRDFLIMEDDEVNFVNGGKGWRSLNGGVLQPGKLYTIGFDDEVYQNTFRFTWNKQGNIKNGESFAAQYLTGSDASRNGWNALGNGMLRHGYINDSYTVQAYNHTDNTYDIIYDNKTFAVGTAFFVQVPAAGQIKWTAAEETAGRPLYAPAREVKEIDEFRLSLRNEASDATNDVLFFSASEEATEAYVIGRDLLKKGTPTEAKRAQMWATKGGKKLCDIETALVNDNATAALSFYAPKSGEYELAIEEKPENATMYLTYNENVIWDLTASPYVLELEKGTTEGYGLRLEINHAPQIATGVDGVQGEDAKARKVIIDDLMYIITPDGEIFSVMGKKVK